MNGEPFAAKGDVLVKPGFRAIYPYGLKKDEQLPALEEGEMLDFGGAAKTHKQTEPPARYSQGKLIQEMEKLGLGTKSTRHSIIERLYTVKYVQNDPIEPSQLGIAVIDALRVRTAYHQFCHDGEPGRGDVTDRSGRQQKGAGRSPFARSLAQELENLLPHQEEVRDRARGCGGCRRVCGSLSEVRQGLQLRSSQKTR